MNIIKNRGKIFMLGYMRILVAACLWLIMSGFVLATSYVTATDNRLEFLGAWKTAPDNADAKYSIYPGSTVRIKLEGTAWLDLKHYNPYDAPHVRVRRLGLNGGTIYTVNNSIKLVANNGPVEYELVFTSIQGVAFSPGQGAYHDTSLYFKGLWLKDGSVLHHATLPDGNLRLDFLGDSITHGVRILKSYGDNVRSQDASQCYGYYLSRALHADYMVRGHSGESTGGLVGKVKYFKKYVPLDPAPDPAYIFINIGANDVRNGSSHYLSDLKTLLTKVRTSFPESYIYVLDFFNQHPNRVPQIKEAILSRASGHAKYFNAAKYIKGLPDNIHPTGASHAALAKALATAIGPAPVVISPVNNATVSKRPELDWTDVEIAESYRVIIQRNGKTYLNTTVGAIDDWVVSKDLPHGNYNWWVQARNSYADFRWSGNGSFNILPYNPTNKAVQIGPSGNVSPTRKPKLLWQDVERATDYYVVVTRNDKSYISAWVKTPMYQFGKDLKNGHYKWWVRAYNADGYGPWSDMMEFDIDYDVPDKIVLVSPNGIKNSAPTGYTWQADSAATWYKLFVNRNGKPYKKNVWIYMGVTNGIVGKSFAEAPIGKYKWWIQAWGPDGMGPWSESMEFSYGVPSLIAPTGVLSTIDSQEFVWTGDVSIPWYQIYISRNGKKYASKWVQSTNWVFATKLPYGEYKWWARAWKDKVMGTWSDGAEFKIGAAIPEYPSGAMNSAPLEFSWDDSGSSNAEWYHIIVLKAGNKVWNKWIKVEDTVDYGGERALENIPVISQSGNYIWWIRAWNHSGTGPWSDGQPFVIQ